MDPCIAALMRREAGRRSEMIFVFGATDLSRASFKSICAIASSFCSAVVRVRILPFGSMMDADRSFAAIMKTRFSMARARRMARSSGASKNIRISAPANIIALAVLKDRAH